MLTILLLAIVMTACGGQTSATKPQGILGKGGGGGTFWEDIANKATTGGASSAITWAESFQSGQPNAGLSYKYNGLCLEFVANAYGASYSSPYDTAWHLALASTRQDPDDPSAAPPGALMFFDLSGSNIPEGHVGISLGGGSMISALEHAPYVLITNVQADGYWRSVYRGWAWPPSGWSTLAAQAASYATDGGNGSKGGGGLNAETTGGSAHTWTDYVHAGGTQGPSIATYQTVMVACKVPGFKVADGNTWWYRIASSPWNNTFYASADTFYNNGQTSGSLHNTPFVDSNVPTCGSSTPLPPPPPTVTPTKTPTLPSATPYPPTVTPRPPTPTPVPQGPKTYPETAGGVAHTWTNYTNAGGTEGPSVAAYQTVQIACKLTGFRVADGNTWWYRIAQSPWNNAYYVSADAFYNNGATSGSLHGTPFVDPNVPNC